MIMLFTVLSFLVCNKNVMFYLQFLISEFRNLKLDDDFARKLLLYLLLALIKSQSNFASQQRLECDILKFPLAMTSLSAMFKLAKFT